MFHCQVFNAVNKINAKQSATAQCEGFHLYSGGEEYCPQYTVCTASEPQ